MSIKKTITCPFCKSEMKEANLGIDGNVKLITRYHEYQKQISSTTQELDLIRIDEIRRYVIYECLSCGFCAL